MNRFQDKVCVITASATGIGLAIAERLASEGGKVVISSRSQRHVDSAVQKLRGLGYTVAGIAAWAEKDVQKLIDFTVATFGGIDIVVANAGLSKHIGKVSDTPETICTRTFQVNVIAPFLLVQAALPYLRKSKAPAVLFNSTNMAFNPNPLVGMYGVSKLALVGLSQCLSTELVSEGIRVNTIAPGLITTNFGKIMDHIIPLIPLKRAGTVTEVANLAAFLLSSASNSDK